MNPKLKAIADKASDKLSAYIKEGESEILAAWDSAVEEAQASETKPKFKLAFNITLDLDADAMKTALTFSVKHELSSTEAIPDPNQIQLPIDEMVAANKLAKKVARN